jgi:transcriptional regulator with XRE-family HTH domain
METLSTMATTFRLREVLEAADPPISQSDFAKDARLSFATINRLCTNATAQVSLKTLDKILAALSKRGVKAEIGDVIVHTPERRARK